MDLNIIKTNLVTVQDVHNIQDLDEFDLPERVFNYYRQLTRNNDFITYNEAKRKIIRNIILGYEAPIKKGLEKKRTFYYGNLILQVNMEERSICYVNISEVSHNCNINKAKRRMLNYIMGIQEDRCYIK